MNIFSLIWRFLVILIVVFVLITGVAIVSLSVWSQYEVGRTTYRDYQKNSNADHQEAAEQIAHDCTYGRVIAPIVRDCLTEKMDAYQKKDTSNKDLQAQQGMAFWAYWLTIISAIGTGVSIVGLFFMFWSLRQTRTAIKDTREIGQKGVRSYVGFKNFDAGAVEVEVWEIGRPIRVKFSIQNIGKTPANLVTYVALCEVRDHPLADGRADIVKPYPDTKRSRTTLQAGASLVAEATSKNPLTDALAVSVLKGKNRCLYLIFRIEYEDVFGIPHVSRGCYYAETKMMTTSEGEKVVAGQWYQAHTHNDAD